MLLLYTKTGCPYCIKVEDFLEQNTIVYEGRNVYEDESFLMELMDKGGKIQIPFLHDTDNNIMMYESNDIIEYLKEK